jgi:DNA repair exonuclease SbcCD ATPase subunit
MRASAQELIEEGRRLDRLDGEFGDLDPKALSAMLVRESELAESLAGAQAEVEQARIRHEAAEERSTQFAELATRALPLLGDRCPVCDQTISAETVKVHLAELVAEGGADLPELALALRRAESRLSELTNEVSVARAKHSELEARLAAANEAQEARAQWREACRSLASSDIVSSDQLEGIAQGNPDMLSELRAALDRLAGISDELAAVLGTTGLGEEVERQRDRVERLREAEMELKDRAAVASREAEEAKTLAGAATRAVAGVTAERFATLQPLVDDIFSRLDPHPAFTVMGFELGVAYRSGIADPYVSDPESGVTADPLLVLSSSQANVAALTYFLALSWSADRKALPFLLLDDPLQSMDDVNALGFADLCRHLRRRRQLIVSTHDHRLAGLLERKLVSRGADQGTRVLRFTGWTRNGPVIEPGEISDESLGFVIEAN